MLFSLSKGPSAVLASSNTDTHRTLDCLGLPVAQAGHLFSLLMWSAREGDGSFFRAVIPECSKNAIRIKKLMKTQGSGPEDELKNWHLLDA